MVGLLYMEYGLNKLFDFPPTPTRMPYRPFSPVPGLTGPSELFRELLIALGRFTRPVALHPVGRDGLRLFHGARAEKLFPIIEQRGQRDFVLLRLPVLRCRRRRRPEHRSDARVERRPSLGRAEAPISQTLAVTAD
jgi:hypothetical protein